MGHRIRPFLSYNIYPSGESVAQNKMGGAFMIHATEIMQEIIELRQLEEAARVQFDAAKNELLRIKRRIKQLEKLLTPPEN